MTEITSEYFTKLIENEEKLKKENAALKEQLKQNSLSQDSFVPVVICKGGPHHIRDTTYATSLESAVTDRPWNFQHTKDTTLPVNITTNSDK